MAHYTLIARINAGNGRFPFVNVQFTKTHRPIPIAAATYYLRRSGGAHTPIRIGKDLAAAHAALLHMDDREVPNKVREVTLGTPSNEPVSSQRKTVVDEAREYLERSKQKSRKTYIGYRTAVNLFAQSCKRTYFDEIRRDDMLDYVYCQLTFAWRIFPRTQRVAIWCCNLVLVRWKLTRLTTQWLTTTMQARTSICTDCPKRKKCAAGSGNRQKQRRPSRALFAGSIYEAKGDRGSEAAQLREYLKYASDPNDVAMVKRYLSELEKPNK